LSQDDKDGEREYEADDENKDSVLPARRNLLGVLDDFIMQVLRIRRMLYGTFLSAVLLAPTSIVLSVYLIMHPAFLGILNAADDFGEILLVLLGLVVAVSLIWLSFGIRQHRSIGHWNKRYEEYLRKQEELERKIAKQYGLSTE